MRIPAPFLGLMFLLPSCQNPGDKHGPSLGFIENVVIVDTASRDPNAPNAFILDEKKAADFLNSARIVSGKEIHDFYNVGDDSYSGTATLSGMKIKWTITNGGTGSITREFDGETYRIADPKQRDEKNLAD